MTTTQYVSLLGTTLAVGATIFFCVCQDEDEDDEGIPRSGTVNVTLAFDGEPNSPVSLALYHMDGTLAALPDTCCHPPPCHGCPTTRIQCGIYWIGLRVGEHVYFWFDQTHPLEAMDTLSVPDDLALAQPFVVDATTADTLNIFIDLSP